ncbi:MAG TPA: type II toxin-antitoxin system RelE/ParE family toxin [Cellvibrio sp.]|nr:type II toxin-antitoxin system RelE/ParE family toxin [Cellvibrio sp.]
MQLKWTDLAAKDLDHIETYIATENSHLVAVEVVLKVINSSEVILSNHPKAGRPGRVSGTRELVIDGVPFILIYRVVDRLDQLQILRVLHDAQQWPAED